jgi:LysR family transcriptional regulator, nitrogen assimilation regulatory protein
MDLDRLRMFQVVCQEGSVSRAAVRLFRTQPAVSMQLATLEAEAGARLLSRSRRGVAPTPAGRRLLACAAELFRAHDRLREAWSGEEADADLRIACSDTVAGHLLPPALRELVRRRPGTRLHLVQSATPESQNRLLRGEVELAFLLRPVAEPRLALQNVLRYRHVAAFPLARGAGAAERGPIDPSALAANPLVLLARGTQTRHLVDEAFLRRGIVPAHVLEVGSVSVQKELVRCGLGVAVLPDYAVGPRDRLRVRAIAGASVRELAAAWRADLPLTQAAEAFLSLLRSQARAEPGPGQAAGGATAREFPP